MPSPFPGMNPFLEQEDVWKDFHQRFVPAMAEALAPLVYPEYVVKIEENLYIHEYPEDDRRLLGFGDVSLSDSGTAQPTPTTAVTVAAPLSVLLPAVLTEHDAYLEIRDRASRELVTVIELLSPTNKRPGPDREQYLNKRNTLLKSKAHFVEIDLLRGWPRMPLRDAPPCEYCVMISRVEDRPRAELWPIRLADPLPVIPIPLKDAGASVALDLQAILYRVYDGALYQGYIYEGSPVPPLAPADAAWAEQLVPAAR